jgi:hypothetical protein
MLVLLNLLVYHLSLVMLVLLNMTSVSVTVSVTQSLTSLSLGDKLMIE